MPTYHVREIMSSPVVTVENQASLEEAAAIMNLNGFRRLPVVDNAGKLVGILTEGDARAPLMAQAAENPYDPDADNWLAVDEAMTREVITVTPNTLVVDVVELLLENKIGGVPVVENGELVGMVTESDVFRLLIREWKPR